MQSISNLLDIVASLNAEQQKLVRQIFRIEEMTGLAEVPELLRPKVVRWCGGTDSTASFVLSQVEKQSVVSVHNLWTFETANFNVLRSCRPVVGAASQIGLDELVDASEGPEKCDFCSVETLTSLEPFGRVRGTYCCTAGNVFKSSGLHSLVIWHCHAPHRLSLEQLNDGFKTADAWFEHAVEWDAVRGQSSYPVMFWNCFKSAGASQIHPHLQLQLFKSPVGQGALIAQQSKSYNLEIENASECHCSDLCADIAAAHHHLGLALSGNRGEICWASLTPSVGGGEFCVLGPCLQIKHGRPQLADLSVSINAIICALRGCGAEGLSIVAFIVPRGLEKVSWFVRCANRGPAIANSVDAGSTELAGLTGVGTDPFRLLEALKREFSKLT